MARIVIGLDPPASTGGDSCGILVCGMDAAGIAHVLADLTAAGLSPEAWARRVAEAAAQFGASRVVAEKNQGGDMIASVLRAVDADLPVRLVPATRSKAARAEPIALTIPSPTRAMIVSSVAPPTNRSRCERTVTRALTFTPMPSCATPSIVVRPMFGLGASMTFGLILVRTASNTVLPVPFVARSMAQARLKSSVIPALSAAINARTTWLTSPPAR